MGVAVGEREATEAGRGAGGEDLAHRAARIVADHGDVVEVEGVEEGADRRRDPGRGEVGAGVHRRAVGAERPVRCDDPVAVGEALQHPVPEPSVDQEAVDEDDRRPGSRLAIVDGSSWQLDRPLPRLVPRLVPRLLPP